MQSGLNREACVSRWHWAQKATLLSNSVAGFCRGFQTLKRWRLQTLDIYFHGFVWFPTSGYGDGQSIRYPAESHQCRHGA